MESEFSYHHRSSLSHKGARTASNAGSYLYRSHALLIFTASAMMSPEPELRIGIFTQTPSPLFIVKMPILTHWPPLYRWLRSF